MSLKKGNGLWPAYALTGELVVTDMSARVSYVAFFAIVDLLAILPFYIEIALREDTVCQKQHSYQVFRHIVRRCDGALDL